MKQIFLLFSAIQMIFSLPAIDSGCDKSESCVISPVEFAKLKASFPPQDQRYLNDFASYSQKEKANYLINPLNFSKISPQQKDFYRCIKYLKYHTNALNFVETWWK